MKCHFFSSRSFISFTIKLFHVCTCIFIRFLWKLQRVKRNDIYELIMQFRYFSFHNRSFRKIEMVFFFFNEIKCFITILRKIRYSKRLVLGLSYPIEVIDTNRSTIFTRIYRWRIYMMDYILLLHNKIILRFFDLSKCNLV